MSVKFYKKIGVLLGLFFMTQSYSSAQQEDLVSALSTNGKIGVEKVAPGGKLPVQVQLINFGSPNERVDVTLRYSIERDGAVVLESKETVAVQTTASFLREIIMPDSFTPGVYQMNLDVSYRNQIYPAISQVQFNIEKKIFGFFWSQWSPALVFFFIPPIFFFIFLWRRKNRVSTLNRNYSHIPITQRTYYEIIHDIIDSIHYHVGDQKMMRIIESIPGIDFDQDKGLISNIEGPAEVLVAQIMHEYENIIGKKANVITKRTYKNQRVKTL